MNTLIPLYNLAATNNLKMQLLYEGKVIKSRTMQLL